MMGENKGELNMHTQKSANQNDFSYIYTQYFTPLFRYILYQTKNRETAEDIVQTVFLKALRQKGRLQHDAFPPLSYFFVIARNTVIDHWRKKREIALNDSEDAFTSLIDTRENPQDKMEKEFDSRKIKMALEKLSSEQKEVLTLRFISDIENKEIARILDKTEEAVRQTQYRAIKKLRKLIKIYD